MEEAAHAVYLGHLQGLVGGHFGEEGRQGSGQHGLAAPGWAGHQDVMASGGGNLQGALGVFLSPDMGEVRLVEVGLFFQGGGPVTMVRGEGFVAAEMVDEGRQRGHREDVNAVYDSGLGLV